MLKLLFYPFTFIHRVVSRFCPRVHPFHVKLTCGTAIVLTGSYMATHPWEIIPHFLWDACAYSIHGYGAAPILYVMRKKIIDLEDMEEKKPRRVRRSRKNVEPEYFI